MIRFLPDSWVDVVMRPLDMVSPEANSYVEIAAPDVRLAATFGLALALVLLWRRRQGSARPVLQLLLLLLLSMAIWLDTTGNGRYFIAWLVLLGPLCIGLVRVLPGSPRRKVVLAGGLAGLQLFVLAGNSPWASWTWVEWSQPPYFQVDKPQPGPATYVTIANISYSLIAPQFPAQSHWIGLGGGVATRDVPVVRKLLATSANLTLLAPAIPSEVLAGGEASAAAKDALGRLLAPHGLLLREGARCTHLHSDGLLRIAHHDGTPLPAEAAAKHGFWLCPLAFRESLIPAPKDVDPSIAAAFANVEKLCPRFFSGGDTPMQINAGWLRHYDSDTKVYLMDDGKVYYKFWRSINAVLIGTREDVLAGRAQVDCTKIRAPNWRRGGP